MTTKIKLRKELGSNIIIGQDFVRLSEIDEKEIAELMYNSYLDTVDYENDTKKNFFDEIQNIKGNLYGVFSDEASLGIIKDGKLISGMFIAIFKDSPTITYQFTNPAYRNYGYARKLIEAADNILYKMGYKYMDLYLSLENVPAYNLYDSLSFEEIPIL